MTPPFTRAPLLHGGDLDAARKLFPGAPEPFLDLSTGINPHPYPIPPLAPEIFARLPEANALAGLAAAAADAYGAPTVEAVVPTPGSQIAVTLASSFVRPARAAVLGPTYAEHARAASLAGHEVSTVSALDALGEADLAIVVNPNNPDGRVAPREDLLGVAELLRGRGGLLIVDEAFMDVGPRAHSLCGDVDCGNLVVLRSFGKFFGLAGLRLSFALAAPHLAARLSASLGPWPVSGEALRIGTAALGDRDWIENARGRLAAASKRLDGRLTQAGLEKVGGTALFSLTRGEHTQELFDTLGRAGILVRRFPDHPEWLRFGLPGAEADWRRLDAALPR